MLAAAVVAGCASTGSMEGQFSSSAGSPRPVTLNYETAASGQSGVLSVTLPGGESFTGRYVRVASAAISPPGPNSDLDFAEIDWGDAADRWAFSRTDSDKVVALLQGNRGGTMRCRFTLVYPTGGFKDGGSGECQVKSGERIDVKF